MLKYKNNRRSKKTLKNNASGGALIETAAGLLVLIPIVLLLVDVIALVIAQSINDDLAKQAARYAAQTTLISNTDGTPNTSAMQNAAYLAASSYVDSTPYAAAVKGLVTHAVIENDTINFNINSNPPQVQVITQITCNLPVTVPFFTTTSTTFHAQATEPIVGIQPTP